MSETNRHAPPHAAKLMLTALACASACPAAAAPDTITSRQRAAVHPGLAATKAATATRAYEPAVRMAGLQSYERIYEGALARGLYDEAETAAKQIIDFLNDAGDRGKQRMPQALARLAFAQRHRQLYAAASQNYLAAIDLLEASENRLSENLIDPLRGLAETYMASGHADLALPAYERALHIRHVNDGPHTLEQVELLEAMATALKQSGQTEAALDIADRMFRLYAQAFAADSEEVLPALERKARLLNTLDLHQQERAVYRDIVDIIRDRRGEYDLSLLQPYSALAHTYFYDLDEAYFRSEPTTETGATFLENALEVTQRNPEATWLMQEQALLELGDYYTLRDVQDRARIHYERAWNLLSEGESRLERRRRDLGRPVTLLRATLDPYANFGYRSGNERAEPEDYLDGYVVVRFAINDRGRVSDVEVADAAPAGFEAMEERVMLAVRDFIFRPRYDDGRPVESKGQRFRHDYRYLASDLEPAH